MSRPLEKYKKQPSAAEIVTIQALLTEGSVEGAAGLLSLPRHTIRALVASARRKAGCATTVQLIAQAYDHGWLHAAPPTGFLHCGAERHCGGERHGTGSTRACAPANPPSGMCGNSLAQGRPRCTEDKAPPLRSVLCVGQAFAPLSDQQWLRLQSVLPAGASRGRKQADDRSTLNGILFVECGQGAWGSIPPEYGSPATCWRRHKQWTAAGLWERIVAALLQNEEEVTRIEPDGIERDQRVG